MSDVEQVLTKISNVIIGNLCWKAVYITNKRFIALYNDGEKIEFSHGSIIFFVVCGVFGVAVGGFWGAVIGFLIGAAVPLLSFVDVAQKTALDGSSLDERIECDLKSFVVSQEDVINIAISRDSLDYIHLDLKYGDSVQCAEGKDKCKNIKFTCTQKQVNKIVDVLKQVYGERFIVINPKTRK